MECRRRIQRSVTKLVHEPFECNSYEQILDLYYDRWKENKDKRYYPYMLDAVDSNTGEINDAIAKVQILKAWKHKGEVSKTLGTALHKYAEEVLNWLPEDGPKPQPLPDVQIDARQLDDFLASEFATTLGLEAYRTEFTVWYKRDGVIVTAGQLDAVFKDKEGQIYIFDWKRVDPSKRLTPMAQPWRYGKYPANTVSDDDFGQRDGSSSQYLGAYTTLRWRRSQTPRRPRRGSADIIHLECCETQIIHLCSCGHSHSCVCVNRACANIDEEAAAGRIAPDRTRVSGSGLSGRQVLEAGLCRQVRISLRDLGRRATVEAGR